MYGGNQMITLARACMGVLIPEGSPIELKAEEHVYVTQMLGGMFTVETESGYLVRIDGKDADALNMPIPEERKLVEHGRAAGKSVEELVWGQLKTCFDPEIPVNIVDLGLVYKCVVTKIDDGSFRVDIEMTLTAPGCGMGQVLKNDVEAKLLEIPEVQTINVEMVFDPAWDRAMMTDEAKLQLGMW